MKTPGQTFVLAVGSQGPLFSSVAVTPLLVAVWMGRADAAKALVAQGASPQAKGVLGLRVYRAELRKPDEPMGPSNGLRPIGRQVELEVTPLGEAQRLGRRDMERLLVLNR